MRRNLSSMSKIILGVSGLALVAACGGSSETTEASSTENEATNAIESAVDSVSEAAGDAAAAVDAAVDDAGEVASDAASSVAGAASDAVDAAADAMDDAGDAASDMMDAAGDAMDGAKDAAEEAMDNAVDDAAEKADEVASAAADGASKLVNNAAGAASAAGAAASGASDTAAEAVNAVASSVPTVHEVQMLNVNPDNPRERMVYVPRVLKVNPGDTIKFISNDPGHNTQSTKGMIPAGAEGWKSLAGKDFEVTLTQPGVYGYNCAPHVAAGMVGLIVVAGDGQAANLEEAKATRQVGLAQKVWQAIWAEADEKGLFSS
ncbi:MAG: pseudoazurin [Pseudomonadota bacterium]